MRARTGFVVVVSRLEWVVGNKSKWGTHLTWSGHGNSARGDFGTGQNTGKK